MKKLSLMSFCLLAASLTAFANGSGYNGPDLKPGSIPVQLDRGISLQAIQDSVVTCLITGDSATGLRSMMNNLAAQMDATSQPGSTKNLDFGIPGRVGIRQLSSSWMHSDRSTGQVDFSMYLSPKNNGNYSQLLVFSGSGPLIGLQLLTPGSLLFPFVAYDKILDDGKFDDFGELILSSKIVSGLKIEFAVPQEISLSRIPLVNSKTNAPARFTLNAEEYIQCMQSQLQKRSEK